MSQKSADNTENLEERRKWGKRPTYPFVDSNGVLVTKNRRKSIEIREDPKEEKPEELAQESVQPAASNNKVPTLDSSLNTSDTAPELPPLLTENELTNSALQPIVHNTASDKVMEIEFQKWRISLSEKESRCSLGRDQSCDLVVLNRFSSRKHGRIEWRNGRFYFCDHSFNGTYIDFDDGRSTHICRDEITLAGSGFLSLGKPTNVDKEYIIRFLIK